MIGGTIIINSKQWDTIKLGTIASFKNGINYDKSSFGKGIKLIAVKNFQDYFTPKYSELDEINPEGVVTNNDLLQNGDILFVRSNGNRELIGRSLFISNLKENTTHSGFTIRLRFHTNNVVPKFYAYLMRSSFVRDVFSNQGYGTNIANLNQKILSDLEVPLPPVQDQNKITEILSAYDDFIEINNRRIKLLEEMAQLIYREWFVNFRFPGHENVKMVESVIGEIPEGWEIRKISDAVFINPQTKVPKEGMKPYLSMGSLSTNSMVISNIETRSGNSGSKFKNFDTLFARITPCLENGKTGFVHFLDSDEDVAFGSTEFIVLRSKTLCPEYVYLLARSDEFRDHAIKSMTGATGRQRVKEECFDNFTIAHPDGITLESFKKLVSPIFDMIFKLDTQNSSLCQTRDLLLPRLISGEIDISKLNIPDSAENEAL